MICTLRLRPPSWWTPDTGTVLFDQNAHEQRYPASITKVMTAMLAIEAVDRGELSLNDVITVGSEVNREVGDGSSTQNIKEGEQIPAGGRSLLRPHRLRQ